MFGTESSPEFPPVESHFRDLAEQMESVFWVVSRGGELTWVSPAFETIWHRPPASVLGDLGEVFLATVHPEDRAYLASWIQEGLELEDARTAHYRIQRPDGSIRRVRTRAFPVRDDQGRTQRFMGLTDDVTDEYESRREMEETARRLRQTFASLSDAVFIVDSGTRTIVECNLAAERIFGYARDELIGSGTRKLHVSQESYEAFASDFDPTLEAEGAVHLDWTMRREDGSTFESRHTVTLLSETKGLGSGVVSVIRDVSHERTLERQFQQSQKLEAVGGLAAGISHDFNNVLTVIQAHAEMVQDALPEASSLRTDLGEILEEVERATKLTRQLLAFGRKQALQPRVVDLAAEIRSMQPTLRRLIPANIDLRIETSEGGAASENGERRGGGERNADGRTSEGGEPKEDWEASDDRGRSDDGPNRVEADPTQLHQVVLNLVTNAVQATNGGGSITLAVDPRELSPSQAAKLPWEARPGAYVRLSVVDTGVGMPPEVRERVFEPFFTTKPPGQGSGLGLASVFGIVKQSRGHITVDSEVGRGTRIDVLLPRTSEAPTAETGAAQRKSAGTPTQRSGTILVAEDDPSLGDLARRVLERAGYSVELATDFPGALALVETCGDALDLLVSDAVMPGMTGAEFLDRARSLRPDLRIVLMSGYCKDELKGGMRAKASAFLEKPFSLDELVRTVDEALAD